MRTRTGVVGLRLPVLCLAIGWQCLVPARASSSCAVVDLMPAFWQALAASDADAQLHAQVIDPHPDLYNVDYVSLPTGANWEKKLASEKAYDEEHRQEIGAAEQYLLANVAGYMAGFKRTFPDYRCDFTFYIAPSFGTADGSAGTWKGQHRIIFAPDVIPRLHQLGDLKVLIDHETFHIYHHQMTGVFGASTEAVPRIEEALWGEGLATFVSWRMNPGVSLDTALLQPGIPAGTQPHLAAIAADLREHLQEKNEAVFGHYFQAGRQPEGYPPRAGYYVGVRVAQALSKRYSLQELARLKGNPLRAAIVAELVKLGG